MSTKKISKANKKANRTNKNKLLSKNINKTINENNYLSFLRACLRKYIEKDVFLYSSNASFFFIIALIPLSMLIFSTISLIPNSDIDYIINELDLLIPSIEEFKTIVTTVVNIAKGLTTKSILSANAIFSIIAATALTHSLSIGISNIHGKMNIKEFITAKFYSFFNMFFLLAVTASLVIVFLFGNMIMEVLQNYLEFDMSYFLKLFNLRYPIALIVLFSFLMSIYTTSTRFKRKFKYNAIGAFISSVLWILVSNIFSIYFTYFPIESGIYGAFSGVIVIMFWLLTCVNVIFIGSIINEVLYPHAEVLKEYNKTHKKNHIIISHK